MCVLCVPVCLYVLDFGIKLVESGVIVTWCNGSHSGVMISRCVIES